jgi:hypothetical protein
MTYLLTSSGLLAVTVELNLATTAIIGGVIFLALAILVGFSSVFGKVAALTGLLLLVGGYYASPAIPDIPTPTPVPVPTPIPTPVPTPPQPFPTPTPTPSPVPPQPVPFVTGIQQSFQLDNGTKEEAALLSALFSQMALSLQWDGQQQQPRITGGNDLGESFARIQRYRLLQQQSPVQQRFPNFEKYVAGEIARVSLTGSWDDPMRKRADAVLLYQAVGDALRTLP